MCVFLCLRHFSFVRVMVLIILRRGDAYALPHNTSHLDRAHANEQRGRSATYHTSLAGVPAPRYVGRKMIARGLGAAPTSWRTLRCCARSSPALSRRSMSLWYGVRASPIFAPKRSAGRTLGTKGG